MRTTSDRWIRKAVSALAAAMLLALAVPSMAVALPPPGTEYWIDATNGDDTNPGTEALPFKSITEGMAHVSGVTTLHVGPGVYTEGATNESLPLTITSGARVVGAGSDVTTIAGPGSGRLFNGTALSASTLVASITLTSGSSGGGGAARLDGGSAMTFERCMFSGNTATGEGGGAIYAETSPITIRDCAFSENTVSGTSGGALALIGSNPRVERSVFEDNGGAVRGGAIYAANVTGSLSRCRFTRNDGGDGGALYTTWGSLTATNCVFEGNRGSRGGAAFHEMSGGGLATTLMNCTIVDNTATVSGQIGGVYNLMGNVYVRNSIAWNNGIDLAVSSVTHSCVEDTDTAGTGVIHDYPRFADPAGGDWSIRRGSPCIDVATDTAAPAVDYLGAARPADGDRDGTAVTDMGAYEVPSAAATIHVSPSGDDTTGAGTEANPFGSVTKGMSVAASGDTVLVHAGTYSPASTDDAFPVWLRDGVRLMGTAAADCVLDAQDASVVVQGAAVDTGTVVSGLTLTGAGAADGCGYGILLNDSTCTISSCVVTACVKADPWEGAAGISCFGGQVTIEDCAIGGDSSNHVGGVYLKQTNAGTVLRRSIVENCSGSLAAVCAMSGAADIEDDLVRDNSGWQGGGVMAAWADDARIVRNTIASNSAGDYAGGVYVMGCSALVSDNVITGNYGANGGGGVLGAFGGTARVYHNTIVGNSVWAGGWGAAGVAATGGATPDLYNLVLRDNGGDDVSAATARYSSVETTADRGFGSIGGDPLFLDEAGGDYRLRHGSPCIDSGDPGTAYSSLDRGYVARPQDGDGDGAASITEYDMGAYEFLLMRLDGGSVWTSDTVVSVECTFTGATEVRVNGGGGFGGWMPYAASVPATLVGGDGTRTVTAEYRYGDGRTMTLSDDILLDTTPPSGSITLDSGATFARSLIVSATIVHGDASSMCLSGDTTGTGWIAPVGSVGVVLVSSGPQTVTLTLRDDLGNTTQTSDSIIVDTDAPTGVGITLAGGAAYTIARTVGAAITCTGATSMRLSGDAADTGWIAPGTEAPVVLTAGDGTKTVTLQVSDDASNVVQATDSIVLRGSKPVHRNSGGDRYGVARSVAASSFPGWAGITHVIIASGEDRAAADPLSAAGLAGSYDAPVLLVKATGVPYATSSAVRAISAANGGVRLLVVGGTVSVPGSVVGSLDRISGVSVARRFSAADRYGVAQAIAAEIKARRGGTVPMVFVANGETYSRFYDALAAGPIASRNDVPVLLTKAGSVPLPTSRALTSLGVTQTARYVVGDKASVSEDTRGRLGVPAGNRIYDPAMAGRYGTAAKLAERAVAAGWLTWDVVGVANKLPDALTGGAGMGRYGGPLLYSAASPLTSKTRALLGTNHGSIGAGEVMGGTLSITNATLSSVSTAINQ